MQELRTVLQICGEAREYSFSIEWSESPPVLHIPGDHRGPDLCYAERPEQEEWLNGLDRFMAPYWYCQWKFLSEKKCHEFIEFLKGVENG